MLHEMNFVFCRGKRALPERRYSSGTGLEGKAMFDKGRTQKALMHYQRQRCRQCASLCLVSLRLPIKATRRARAQANGVMPVRCTR